MASSDQLIGALLGRMSYQLEGLVLSRSGKPTGLLQPAALFAWDVHRHFVAQGRRGTATARDNSVEEVIAALLAAGALMLGTEEEIGRCRDLLADARTSRSFAYLCCMVESCGEALASHERVRAGRVLFLGCGGIGSLAAVSMAGAGVAEIFLVDADIVEESNLNRQLFFDLGHIGRPKVDVVREAIAHRFPDVTVSSITKTIEAGDVTALGADANAILLTADHPLGLPPEIGSIAASKGMFLVHAGYGVAHGIVKTCPQREICWTWHRLAHSVMPSAGPINLELAGVASNLVLQHLAFDTESPRITTGWTGHQYPRQVVLHR